MEKIMREENTFRNRMGSAGRAAKVLAMMVLSFLLGVSAHAQQVVTTFSPGAPGDPFASPTYVAVDPQGNIFVSDTGKSRIQRIDSVSGVITTVVGTGVSGFTGDGGAATSAKIGCPMQMVFDASGNLLFADRCDSVVRKVAPKSGSTLITGDPGEIITTFAGNGVPSCGPADSIPATQASLAAPDYLAIDKGGNVFIHSGCDIFYRVDATTGIINETNILGDTGADSMAFDNFGDLVIGWYNGLDMASPAPGQQFIAANAGSGRVFNTPASLAGFAWFAGIAFDKAGNAFLANADASATELFKVNPGSDGFLGSTGTALSKIAGDGNQGYSGDGGDPLAAEFFVPRGVAFNGAGNLLIADSGNNVIRAILNGTPTAAGAPVTVNPLDQNGVTRVDISLTFDDVTTAGGTAVLTGQNAPPLPPNFELAGAGKVPPPVFYDIVTTAQFTGSITVCINTPTGVLPGLSLWHFNKATGNWDQISTGSVLPGAPQCGVVTSLSPFALLEPITKNQAPTISSGSSATFQTGAAGSFSVTTTGSPTPAISASGSLPGGVNFTDNGDGTAALGGMPGAGTGGTYPVTITATNGVSPDATQSFVLTVNQAPAIVSANSATFTVGTLGAFTVTATGFPAPTLSATGAMPGGVGFNPATGSLSGTPTSGGVFTLTMTAGNGVGANAVQTFTLTVNQAPAITSANSAAFTLGTAGSFKVTSTGFPTPTVSETGALPAGINFVSNGDGTGTASGTPTVSGVFPITFTANNGVGSGASQGFTLTVSGGSGGPVVTLSPASLDFGNVPLYHLATGQVSLQNSGTSPLVISKMGLTLGPNTDRDDFLFLSLCGNTLAPGKSCTIYFLFYADNLGSHSATLNITDNAAGGQNSIALTGAVIKPVH